MIIRRRHTANYTTIGNVLFEDERLAADEVGILAYLLSRPHDWEVRRPALMRRWGMGRDAIKRVITNLVRFGWCRPERTRLPNGTTFVIYEIRDEPGPELSDDEIRRALSLGSSEAAHEDTDAEPTPDISPDAPLSHAQPPTPYPSLVDPPPDNPSLAYIDIQTKDLPRTESTQKQEREHARVREKHALNLAEFKRRWPTNATDDQTRVDNAWFALSFDEGEGALAGIAPFFEAMKRARKDHAPAGFNYLGQKRWTLLDQAPSASAVMPSYPRDSAEAKAVRAAYEIAGTLDAFHKFMLRGDSLYYRGDITPKLLKLAETPQRQDWVSLDRQQAAAWDALLAEVVKVSVRHRLREGSRAPWPWPPRKDGTLSPEAPPGTTAPDTLMTEQDFKDFT